MCIRDRIRDGKFDKVDNPIKNAPHTIEEVSSDNWDHKYTRKEAAYPHAYLINNKYWSPVSRIDNVYGDRNLFCVCPPIVNTKRLKPDKYDISIN